MARSTRTRPTSFELRGLAPADLDAVVAIDASLTGRRRQL